MRLGECASQGSQSDGNQVWRKDKQTASYVKDANWAKQNKNDSSHLKKKINIRKQAEDCLFSDTEFLPLGRNNDEQFQIMSFLQWISFRYIFSSDTDLQIWSLLRVAFIRFLTPRNWFGAQKPVLHYRLGYSSVCVGSVQLYSRHRSVHMCTTSL